MPYMHRGTNARCSAPVEAPDDTVLLRPGNMMHEDTKAEQEMLLLGPMKGQDGLLQSLQVQSVGYHSVNENGMDMMQGVSRPPSPPESQAATPRVSIRPCPSRLSPLIPPPNYGAVMPDAVFRSAFPADRNLDFLRALDVRSILCLVDTEPTQAYQDWLADDGIYRRRIDVAPNKDGNIKTTWDSLCEALLFVMDAANYPLYIHCNQGRHRTGCVLACWRKIQRWQLEDVLAEYEAYASPKARTGDIDLICAFEPDAVFEYAKRHGYFDGGSFMRRMDSTIVNIDALAEALASTTNDSFSLDWDMSAISKTSSNVTEDGLMMGSSVTRPTLPRSKPKNGCEASSNLVIGAGCETLSPVPADRSKDVKSDETAEASHV